MVPLSMPIPDYRFIPAPNEHLQGLTRVNAALLAFVQSRSPQGVATLDRDATLVETTKEDALSCYKKFKAYQPFNKARGRAPALRVMDSAGSADVTDEFKRAVRDVAEG